MKILFYIEPRIDRGQPYMRHPWVQVFSRDLMNTLNKSDRAGEFECCIALNEALYNIHKDKLDIKTIVFTQKELNSCFDEGSLGISAAWVYRTYTDRQMSYFVDLMKDRFAEFVPDIIITFTPVPFLQKAFPGALVLHHECDFLSRPPFPLTFYLDPLGVSYDSSSFLCRFGEEISRTVLTSRQSELVNEFKQECRSVIRDISPFDDIMAPLRDRFDHLVLLPLSHSEVISFYSGRQFNFQSQYDFLQDILEKTPHNIGVIVTVNPNAVNDVLLNEAVHFLESKYPNFIFHEDFEKYRYSSQYLLSYVDAVIARFSSLCFQTLLWDIKLISPATVGIVADSGDFLDIERVLSGETASKDHILYWMLTRHAILTKYLYDPDWLPNYLISSLDKFRNGGINFDFFEAIDNDDDLFKELTDGLARNYMPAFNSNMSYFMLNKLYNDTKIKYDGLANNYEQLKKMYNEACSKDIYLDLEAVVQEAEKLFGDGKVDEATRIFTTMLEKNNKITGTVMNNLAVIHAHKGDLDAAESFLNHIIKQGYDSGEAQKNLELVKSLRIKQ